ncbi:hypothetical protein C8F01DRAFT_1231024 [Mycena amicta]|nr:hypothetical protein C8F01DRAFT_1231024 [Mycena amicta]
MVCRCLGFRPGFDRSASAQTTREEPLVVWLNAPRHTGHHSPLSAEIRRRGARGGYYVGYRRNTAPTFESSPSPTLRDPTSTAWSSEAHRRKGLTNALMHAAHASHLAPRRPRLEYVFLGTSDLHPAAQTLYDRLGFIAVRSMSLVMGQGLQDCEYEGGLSAE